MDAAVLVSSRWSYVYFFVFRILIGVFFIPIFTGSVIDGARRLAAVGGGAALRL
jgi:hypothetical protein